MREDGAVEVLMKNDTDGMGEVLFPTLIILLKAKGVCS